MTRHGLKKKNKKKNNIQFSLNSSILPPLSPVNNRPELKPPPRAHNFEISEITFKGRGRVLGGGGGAELLFKIRTGISQSPALKIIFEKEGERKKTSPLLTLNMQRVAI